MYEKSEPIFIYDRDENLQLILSDDSIPYRGPGIVEQLNGQFTLEIEVLADNSEVGKIENDGRAITRNADGSFAEFIIRNIEDVDDSNGTFKVISAESSDYELIDEFLVQYTQGSVGLRTALSAILQGTRFEVGEVDLFNPRSVDLRNMSVKSAVLELLDIFNAEVRYRVEVKGNRITRRYIDVYSRRGDNFGKRFEDGKDILSTTRNIDSAGIKTALYGRGASDENGVRLDFSRVEWREANGDPVDKPLGQSYVGDPEALAIHGHDNGTRHRFGMYDGQEEDPAELLLNTWQELQTLTKPRETYDFTVIQLAELLGIDYERVRLGDTVLAVNRRINPPVEVEASIIEYRHNLNDRRLSEVTLGQFRSNFDASRRIRDIERDYNDKRGEFDKKPSHEDVETEAQKAIDEAQKRLDQAKQELEQAMEDIENGMIELDDAMAIADDVFTNKINQPQNYEGYFTGDVGITGQLHVAGTIIGGSGATIRGTLNANNLNLYSANILNANIQNANITGTLNGVDGRFIGQLDGVNGTFVGDLVGGRILSNTSINVDTNLYVGNNIYLGYGLSQNKRIHFSDNATISSVGDFRIMLDASQEIRISTANVNATRAAVRAEQYYSNNGTAAFYKFDDSNYLRISRGEARLYLNGLIVERWEV